MVLLARCGHAFTAQPPQPFVTSFSRLMMPMPRQSRPITVAIAGQGRSGYRIHANWLKRVPDQFQIVAVADERPARRRDAERQFSARTYANHSELIAAGGFELFINALPTEFHVAATVDALTAGAHVVCEKPVATTVAELDRMSYLARTHGRLLVPFQNYRLQPFVVKMMDVVSSGVLGDIVHVRSTWGGFARRWDWQTLQRHCGGVLFTTGPHAIDLGLLFLPEDDDPRVDCTLEYRNSLGGDADDLCSLSLHSERGPRVEILITSYLAYPADTFVVSGTRGSMIGNEQSLRWKYFDPDRAPRRRLWPRWSIRRDYPRETLDWVEESWSVERETLQGASSGYTLKSFQIGVKRFYDNLYLAVRNGEPLVITIQQVRRQIAILEAAHRQNAARAKRARRYP